MKMPMNFSREAVLITSCVVLCLMLFHHTVSYSSHMAKLEPPRHRQSPSRNLPPSRYSSENGTDKRRLEEPAECHVVHRYLNSCSSLPNYFLYGAGKQQEYRNSIMNFWHVQKTGGTTLEHCLIEMFNDQGYNTMHINISSCDNHEQILKRKKYFQEAAQPLIRGHSSLGFCEFAQEHVASQRRCSNFAIFREPFERMVSFYYYSRETVKNNIRDPDRLRRYLNRNITEWVKNRGSSYWMGFTQGRVLFQRDNSTGACVRRHKSASQKWAKIDAFSESIVDNLDKYFSVVGLTEDFAGSLELFQRVYGSPFVESCSNLCLLEGTYGNRPSSVEQRRLKERAKRDLMEDEETRRLMRFDVMIYEKAKELYYKQMDQLNKLKERLQ